MIFEALFYNQVNSIIIKRRGRFKKGKTNAYWNLLLDADEASSIHYTYGASPDGETDDTRFIMSRKGKEVEPALKPAMKAKTKLEELWGP